MSEESFGNKPEKTGSSNQTRDVRSRNQDRSKREHDVKTSQFEGTVPSLKAYIFDVAYGKGDSFNTNLKKTAEYISVKVPNGGYMMNVLNPRDIGFDTIIRPKDPSVNATPVEMEIWKTSFRNYNDQVKERKKVTEASYAILIGQCTDALRDTMETYPSFENIRKSMDVVELAKLIRLSMYAGTATGKPTMTYVEAEEDLLRFRQTRKMTNIEYMELFRNKVEVYEHLGGEPGSGKHRVEVQLAKNGILASKVTPDETKKAKAEAREDYLCGLFLKNSNETRYGEWLVNLEVTCMHGLGDPYPSTMAKAFEYLETWDRANKAIKRHRRQPRRTDFGVAYNIDEEDEDRHGNRYEDGARGGGRGRTRGRGRGRGGRGKKTRHPSHQPTSKTNRDATHKIDGQEVEDHDDGIFEHDSDNSNSKETTNNYSPSICYSIKKAQRLNRRSISQTSQSIIIDSASTSDIFSDPAMVHSIHPSNQPLKVNTLSGQTIIKNQAYVGDYPPPVWYHPSGGVNILSLNNVRKYYKCTMDTSKDNAIFMHLQDGSTIKFKGSGKGLYQYTLKQDETIDSLWSLMVAAPDEELEVCEKPHRCFSIGLDTVQKRRDNYTLRQQRNAFSARNVEDIVMRPGSRRFTDVCLPHLKDCPLTAEDARAAVDILGKNLGSLKGKTVYRPNTHIKTGTDPVPRRILRLHRRITLAIDIMFVNRIPFLVTTSRKVKFGTVEALPDRKISTVVAKLQSVIQLYNHRGFRVTTIAADPEFEPIRPWFPMLNTCAAGEHVPEIERYIRTIKDSTRSTYRMLPFTHVPRLVLVHLVKNAVFWLNAFPATDGVSSVHSPRYFITGFEVTYHHHVREKFGQYVQTHEEHTNDMAQRTTGAICLGPSGNQQGGHWFLCLSSGARILRHRWTHLPMPREVIDRVNAIGIRQRMPSKLTYANRYGNEIEDTLDDITVTSTDDTSYAPSTTSSFDTSDDEHDSDDDDNDDSRPIDAVQDRELRVGRPDIVPTPPAPTAPTGVSHNPTTSTAVSTRVINLPTATTQNNLGRNTGVEANTTSLDDGSIEDMQTTEVDESTETTGVGNEMESSETTGVGDEIIDNSENQSIEQLVHDIENVLDQEIEEIHRQHPTEEQAIQEAEQEGRTRANNDDNTRPIRQNRGQKKDNDYVYLLENEINPDHRFDKLVTFIVDNDPIAIFKALKDGTYETAIALITEQMSERKGLKTFGKDGADAIKKELEQLIYRKVMHGKRSCELTREQKRAALRYLMFLKQKRCGRIKGRGCADGRKQRVYKTKEETSSPTIHTESLFLTCIIDALEKRRVVTLDIPGAFMQTDIDEIIHVKLVGELAELLTRVDPSYNQFVTYENKKKVIYTELDKALYGTLQAALLFWKELSKFLENDGFKANPYDPCVMNKVVNGKQMTVGWHVDDLKISHVSQDALEELISKLEDRFGKEAPLTIKRGAIHEYLGMKIDFSNEGKVLFSMLEYIDRMLADAPEELMKGPCTSPAANHLFNVNENATKLDASSAIIFHHLTAQLLYLAKRTRPDLLLAVSFLCTRVQEPDEDDWKKLGRCLRFLRDNKGDVLTLVANGMNSISWWIDASFAVHPNMRSHTGATMSMGKGCPISISSKQKINTRSSTEAELVGVNDAMFMVLWVRHFLECQGYDVVDNVVYQDNQSTMRLARNGKQSSTKNTRHIEIRYFFVTDNIRRNKLSIEYCPTDDMLGDYFTKPQQGSRMRKSRQRIMNLPHSHASISQECVGASGTTSRT